MTETLSAAAASDYLRLTLFAFDHGLIGRTHFDARLDVLRAIANPEEGAAQYAAELRGLADDSDDPPWPAEDGESEGERNKGDASGSTETSGPYYDEADQSLALKIVAGPLKGWKFHQADDDWFPSIPHGHEHGRKQPKLDVYLGWVYKKDEKIRRVGRASIVSLWNDRHFRAFAKIAIDYYIGRFPAYSGWHVANPRILPAIRRGRRYR